MAPLAPQLRPLDPDRPVEPSPEVGEVRSELRNWLQVLRRRLWVILVVATVVSAGMAIKTLRQQKVYTASVSIVIELQAPKVLGDQVQDVADSQGSFWQAKDFFETQFLFLRSKAVASRVVRRLQLDRDEEFLGVAWLRDPNERAAALRAADANAILRSRIKVEPVRDSHVVRVMADDPDPQKAALLANTIADEFIAFNLDEKLGTSKSASEWLHGQMDELQKRLADSESHLYQYKRENDILTATIEDSQSIVSRRLAAVNDALTQVGRQRAEAEARVKQVRIAQEINAISALPQVENSAVVQGLRNRVQQLAEELAEARTRYGEEHPRIGALRERKQQIEQELAEEEQRIARSSDLELSLVRDTEQNLKALLDSAKREAFELNKKEVDFSRLRREQENNAKVVEMVLRRLKDVDLSSMLRTNNVRLLDSAETPLVPSSPNLKFDLVVALVAGLVLGIGSALLLEQLDNTLKGQEDVERATRVSFLGIIPEVRDPQAREQVELYVHRRPQSTVAECVRTVRTNLLFLSTERPLQKLMVTSSGPQEGKTTAVVDLGITFAQSGQRVLMVDTDMRRPRLHTVFGFANDLGLSSVLLDESKLGEAIKGCEVPNLFVLPCGPIPPNPAELLHTERFHHVVAELSRRFDRVLFDSPPVSAVTDALILSSGMDGVVLLGKAGKTTRDQLARARRSLADVDAKVVGALLNSVDLSSRGGGYYYDYYGRYGAYHGEREEKA